MSQVVDTYRARRVHGGSAQQARRSSSAPVDSIRRRQVVAEGLTVDPLCLLGLLAAGPDRAPRSTGRDVACAIARGDIRDRPEEDPSGTRI